MGLGYKRSDLQANAQRKLDDAIILLRNNSHSNAYYLAGYAVEIGLKACIAAQVAANTIPSKELLKGFLDHDFRRLVGLAGLAAELKKQQDQDPNNFGTYWALASEWNPDSRYDVADPMSAQLLVQAVSDQNAGVLPWIKTFW